MKITLKEKLVSAGQTFVSGFFLSIATQVATIPPELIWQYISNPRTITGALIVGGLLTIVRQATKSAWQAVLPEKVGGTPKK